MSFPLKEGRKDIYAEFDHDSSLEQTIDFELIESEEKAQSRYGSLALRSLSPQIVSKRVVLLDRSYGEAEPPLLNHSISELELTCLVTAQHRPMARMQTLQCVQRYD